VTAPAADAPRRLLVDGEWRATPDVDEVRSPYDGRLVARVCRASPAEVEAALVAAAREAAHPPLPAHRRATLLRGVGARIEAEREHLARTLALEAGKPIRLARAEADRAASTFRAAAREAERLDGEAFSLDGVAGGEGRWAITRRFPVGVVAAITPFNFPLNLVAHKLAPAVAAGCPVVLKPASQTPLSALALARLLQEEGAPPGSVAVLPCGSGTARALVEDPRPALLTFTGSAEVGWALKARAGRKRVTLELGGNAGVLVLADADLDLAARRCAEGGFAYAGQSCISVQRVLVHRHVGAEFEARLIAAARGLKLGDPLDEAVTVGPMISEAEARRAEAWVREALDAGARRRLGGEREGAMLLPTVLADVRPSMRVACQEVFAPVVGLTTVASAREGIERLGASDYGLQAGVFTRDLEAVLAAFETVEVGALLVNEVPTFRLDTMPYGGVKGSGIGREGPRYAVKEMTEPRLLVLTRLGGPDPAG
jgi:acyl-CoA reductase-like NAD-dependent aldehyde dehydrogenase